MFQSWTSLVSRSSSSSSSSSSTYNNNNNNIGNNQTYTPYHPYSPHPNQYLPRPPVDIIITPATPYLSLSHPTHSGNGAGVTTFTPQQAGGEMRSRRRGSAGAARVLDYDRVVTPKEQEEVEVVGGVVSNPEEVDDREEENDAAGYWGQAYEEIEMGPTIIRQADSRSVGVRPSTPGVLEGEYGFSYGRDNGVVSSSGGEYQTIHSSGEGMGGNGWAYFPSSSTGYRRFIHPHSTTTAATTTSTTNTTSSSSSSPSTQRLKLNLLLFFFALALASLGMISLMLPSLGGVEFGVRVVAHDRAHAQAHAHGHPAVIGVEEGLDGLRLGAQVGHAADGLKKMKRSMDVLPDTPVAHPATVRHADEEDIDVDQFTLEVGVVVDERTVNAHQVLLKQSRERLRRRLDKVGQRERHVGRKRRSWGIWAA